MGIQRPSDGLYPQRRSSHAPTAQTLLAFSLVTSFCLSRPCGQQPPQRPVSLRQDITPPRIPDLLGHGTPWQALVSRPLPLQFLPPIWGTGELQRRMRVTLPTPQVTEHDDQGDQ